MATDTATAPAPEAHENNTYNRRRVVAGIAGALPAAAIGAAPALAEHNPFAKPPAVLGRLKAVERILE